MLKQLDYLGNLVCRGYTEVCGTEPADIVVVNTCTVTENGDSDLRRLVRRVNTIHKGAKIALIGCAAQIHKEQLLELPGVQWVVGNMSKMTLPDIVADELSPQVIVPKMTSESFALEQPAIDPKHKRANLKIQDGCDFYCSFCVIPFARGPARSRDFDDILTDARALAAAGHKEVVLTGINLGTYSHSTHTILDVVKQLETIDGIKRIRISSIEPTTVPEALITKMGQEESALCRYLHLPIQSGSDTILDAMRRKYTVAEYTRFSTMATLLVDKLCLGTDIIVGFPGETDVLFDETYDTLSSLPFAYFHVFSYSERKLTRSRKLVDKVPIHVIQRRSQALRELSASKMSAYCAQFLGHTEWVLFEQKKKGVWVGLTDRFIRVFVESKENLENQYRPVTLTSQNEQGLIGQLA